MKSKKFKQAVIKIVDGKRVMYLPECKATINK